jgi:hypothetical protein
MTTTRTTDDTAALHQHLLKRRPPHHAHPSEQYPATDWSLEESMVVLDALAEITLWRQRGIRGVSSRRPLLTSNTGTACEPSH